MLTEMKFFYPRLCELVPLPVSWYFGMLTKIGPRMENRSAGWFIHSFIHSVPHTTSVIKPQTWPVHRSLTTTSTEHNAGLAFSEGHLVGDRDVHRPLMRSRGGEIVNTVLREPREPVLDVAETEHTVFQVRGLLILKNWKRRLAPRCSRSN